MSSRRDRKPVYSTEGGDLCPECGRSRPDCICAAKAAAPAGDGVVRVARQTKGRRGKAVSVITGVPLTGPELADLAGDLKRACGTGGTIKNGVIEIQGDRHDQLVTLLQARGWTVKKSGG